MMKEKTYEALCWKLQMSISIFIIKLQVRNKARKKLSENVKIRSSSETIE